MPAEYKYYRIYKPFGMLSQFSSELGKRTLGELFSFPKDVYPVGRLDEDSEGLLLLTNDPAMNQQVLGEEVEKEYWVQVEGIPGEAELDILRKGIELRIKGVAFKTRPAVVKIFTQDPALPERNPPIRFRKNIPTSWISIRIREGKNRQVRKMTAAIAFPTLRLVRWSVSKLTLEGMEPGEVVECERFFPGK